MNIYDEKIKTPKLLYGLETHKDVILKLAKKECEYPSFLAALTNDGRIFKEGLHYEGNRSGLKYYALKNPKIPRAYL